MIKITSNSFKKHKSTFLFYDYETFGIHPALDKPAQFACIRTDIDLNIITRPKRFYCIPSDDYLPDPNSILITRITPSYTQKNGTNECRFAKKIHDILSVSNTCIIGYNNINFDDEITRNIFYRNFFDPYEWSWKNSNSRWDLLNLVRACCALRPNGIAWPKNVLGFPSFKLSDLTRANNLQHNSAHDALSDVYATIQIAKLIKNAQPKLFNFFFQNRNKKELYKLIDLKKFEPMIYVSSCFGSLRQNISTVVPIIWHKNNKNILITIDLFKDVDKLIEFSNRISDEKDYIKHLFDLGIVLLHINRAPMLAPMKVIREQDSNRLNLNSNLYYHKIALLKKNSHFIIKIQNIFSKDNHVSQSSNVDLKIYDAFLNLHDKKIVNNIRNTHPVLLSKKKYHFFDPRLKVLLFRYRARNFFYTLNKNEKKRWLKHCFKILNSISLKDFKNKIIDLLKKNSSNTEDIIILNDVLNYVYQKYESLINIEIN